MEHDGFDVCELDGLDRSSSDDENWPTELADVNEEDDNPFMITLMSRTFVMSEEVSTKLSEAKEGCSPTLLAPSINRPSLSRPPLKLRRAVSVAGPSREPPKPETAVSKTSFKRPGEPFEGQTDTKKFRPCSKLSPVVEGVASRVCSVADVSDLTADGRRQLLLPIVPGSAKNRDLNNVDCHTLAQLITGRYDEEVASFRIIDARFAYEYDGGHIVGAENFGRWNDQEFVEAFLPEKLGPKISDSVDKENEPQPAKRDILIFHCEFSSFRGPSLLRWLRNMDRERNNDNYPALHYPECYLLHEGYKEFFQNYPDLCQPKGYVSMDDPRFTKLERQFHKKSKTWAGGGGSSTVSRTKFMTRRGNSCEEATSSSSCAGKKSLFR